MSFSAGQCWTFHAPPGYEMSRLVIGAIVTFDAGNTVICCAVSHAPRRNADGTVDTVCIPFLPMTDAAFRESVIELDGAGEPPASFAERFEAWSEDPRGLTVFTVPYAGSLDRMIAAQMEQIVGQSAA